MLAFRAASYQAKWTNLNRVALHARKNQRQIADDGIANNDAKLSALVEARLACTASYALSLAPEFPSKRWGSSCSLTHDNLEIRTPERDVGRDHRDRLTEYELTRQRGARRIVSAEADAREQSPKDESNQKLHRERREELRSI